MKTDSASSVLPSVLVTQAPAVCLVPALIAINVPALPRRSQHMSQFRSLAFAPRSIEGAAIYAVDDDREMTELYALLLDAAGYNVKVFHERSDALAALKAETIRPDLLITDYRGRSMPTHQFMRECLVLYPALRILMASGFHPGEVRFTGARPDRFIQKPFTAEELLRDVRAALTG